MLFYALRPWLGDLPLLIHSIKIFQLTKERLAIVIRIVETGTNGGLLELLSPARMLDNHLKTITLHPPQNRDDVVNFIVVRLNN
jgi:hypothetical protein